MSQAESANRKTLPWNVAPNVFLNMGKKRIEDFVNAQSEFFEQLQESNKQWLDRLQTETNFASEFVSRLTAVRSIPDVMTVCREWSSRGFEHVAEDGQHVFADFQKFMAAGARLLTNGWVAQTNEAADLPKQTS